MARRKRQSSTFNLSFLDIMSCGFGAVVLVFLIIDHSLEVEIRTVNAEVLSEVELLCQWQIQVPYKPVRSHSPTMQLHLLPRWTATI